jgi:MFS family permease
MGEESPEPASAPTGAVFPVVNVSLRKHTNPIVFLFLRLPFGISMGFITVTLPFWLSEAGVSVTQIGFIEVVALSPITGRVLLALVVDLTWSPRTWFAVATVVSALAVALLGLLPLRTSDLVWVTVIAFVYALAINCLAVPVGVLLARTVEETQRGRAAGWYMAANIGGAGLGGGAGLWLGTHVSHAISACLAAITTAACITALRYTAAVPGTDRSVPFGRRSRQLWRGLLQTAREKYAPLLAFVCLSPIGAGAMSNLWSAVGPAWRASADVIALGAGVVSGVGSTIGCVLGGWVYDRRGMWHSYFGSGLALAVAALAMAIAPRSPAFYLAGITVYSLALGWAYAAFAGLCAWGSRGPATATVYAFWVSINNVPGQFMTAANAWVFDHLNATAMLVAEALVTIVALRIGSLMLRKYQVNLGHLHLAPS